MADRNGYMLRGALARRGYDWWWHSMVGISRRTGEKRPFFIEYFVINPALGGTQPILGQLPANQAQGIKPAYAMLKAGCWGKGTATQIHNFYPITLFSANPKRMDVCIGPHFANETRLKGAVRLTPGEARDHPEYLSDAGEMSWDLRAEKVLSYSAGFGASAPFRALNAFQMYWHAAGMQTHYQGTIVFNGEEFAVEPETCAGYQDKNWGSDYTSPWVWLSCNTFTSRGLGIPLDKTSLDVGGARPVAFGIALPRRLLIACYYQGELFEFNFSKIWTRPHQAFDCPVSAEKVEWNITAWNTKGKIEIHFACPRETMLNVHYENPDGRKRHNQLWNGGFAAGTVTLYRRINGQYVSLDTLDGELGGCEYGEAS